MFDKLIEFILSILNELLPFVILREYEEGVMLRFGKYNRTIAKGIHFKIPLVDMVLREHTIVTTLNLNPQSLFTKDRQNIVVKGLVKFRIADIKTYLLEVWGSEDALSDITQGIIKGIIMSKSFEECTDNEIDNAITKKARVEAKKWGIEILQVTLTDIAPIRSFRLINDIMNKGHHE